jgi:flagellar motor switch protein FliG
VSAVAGLPATVRASLPAAEPTPIQKAAIILTAIGPDLASSVLREVSPENLKRFAKATASLGPVSQPMLDAVILDFIEALAADANLTGGPDAARRLLAGILDEEQIAELLGELGKTGASVWERLNLAPLAAIAAYVGNEHPQTAAVILSEVKAEVAANVLEKLNQSFAREVVLRLSRVPSLDRRTVEAISGAIDRDFLSALQRSLSKRRPAELIAGLMNNISSEAREGFLTHLEESSPDLAQDVQRSMFTFADIATRLSGRDVGNLVRDISEEVLLPALKWGQMQGSDSVGFILENIPRRLAERYVDDLASMEDLPRKDGEAAHIELTKIVLAQHKAGRISFLEREDG